MISTCDKHTTDIISLKRPTGLDKLAESIPKPQGAIPNFGLPKWKVMPLESKIPMVPGPEGAYNFSRRKIGKELWIPALDAEFNLSDPYCYEMELTYDSLHDKHLVPYFSRPNIIRQLIKAGLVTKNLDAKCSLRDYNMYRKYLRKLHCDSIRKELNRRSKWSTEERAIQYAQEQAQKEVRRLKERERLMKLRAVIIRNRKIAEKLKLQKQKEIQQKIEERLQALQQKKQDAINLQRIKSKARAETIRQKQKAAAEHERHKIIQTLLEWSKKERIRKKTREMRLAHEQEEKKKIVEQKWEERQNFQKQQIEKEQFLLQCIENQRKDFIKRYNEKIKKETERMRRLLKDVKMFIKCYLARRHGSKERICCEKDFDDDDYDMNPVPSMKADKQSISKLMHTSRTVTKQDIDKTKRERIKVGKDKGKKRVMVRQATKGMQRKMKVVGRKARKKKSTTIQEGGKRRKRKRKKQSKKKADEEEKPEFEATRESIATVKTETSSTTSSIPSEKCRCQIIKNVMRAATT